MKRKIPYMSCLSARYLIFFQSAADLDTPDRLYEADPVIATEKTLMRADRSGID